MRLGQFARKLNVKPQEIAEFLKNEFELEISVHPNSKIEDEYIEAIKLFFSKEEKEKIVSTEERKPTLEENINEEADPKKHNDNQEVIETTEEIDIDVREEEVSDEHELTEEDLNIVDGIIKAPEVEVSGVKVVGKIEIPEKKTEEADESEESNDSDSSLNEETSKSRGAERSKKPKKRRGKKELSYEEQKKRELEKYEKEKQRKLEQEKQKKKKYYEEKVLKKVKQNNASRKKNKKKQKHKEEEEELSVNQPKTLWGKFIRWLNT